MIFKRIAATRRRWLCISTALCICGCSDPSSTLTNNTSAENAPLAPPHWTYRVEHDSMRKTRTWVANLFAANPAQLSFPYQGGTRAVLELVQDESDDPNNRQATLIIQNGQIDCSGDCYLSVKFDDGEVFTSTGTRTDCGEDQCVNIHIDEDEEVFGTPKSIGFHQRLRTSKRVIVEVPLYRFGTHQFEFSTKGLVWPQPDAPKRGNGSGLRDGSTKLPEI